MKVIVFNVMKCVIGDRIAAFHHMSKKVHTLETKVAHMEEAKLKTQVADMEAKLKVIFDNCGVILTNALESVLFEAAKICNGALRHTTRNSLLTELG